MAYEINRGYDNKKLIFNPDIFKNEMLVLKMAGALSKIYLDVNIQ